MKRSYKLVMLSVLMCASVPLQAAEGTAAKRTADLNELSAKLSKFAGDRTEDNRREAVNFYNNIKAKYSKNRNAIEERLNRSGLTENNLTTPIVTPAPAGAAAAAIPAAPLLAPVPAAPPARTAAEVERLRKRKAAIDAAEAEARRQDLSTAQIQQIQSIETQLQNLGSIIDSTVRAQELKFIADRIVDMQRLYRAAGKTRAADYLETLMVEARRVNREPQEDLAGDFTFLFAGAEEAEAKAAAQVEQEVQGLINRIRAAVQAGGSVTTLTNANWQLGIAAQRIANANAEQRNRIADALATLNAAVAQARTTEAAAKTAADAQDAAERERKRLEQENKDRAAREAAARAEEERKAKEAKDAAAAAAAAQAQTGGGAGAAPAPAGAADVKAAAASGALNAGEWTELSGLKDKINGMTSTPADENRARALVARANANPPTDNAQLLILNAAKAAIASL